MVNAPVGGKSICACPTGLCGFVGQVPIDGGAADPEVFSDVLRGMAVGLHPRRGRDVSRIGHLLMSLAPSA